jgi:hypothetical protein
MKERGRDNPGWQLNSSHRVDLPAMQQHLSGREVKQVFS